MRAVTDSRRERGERRGDDLWQREMQRREKERRWERVPRLERTYTHWE